MTIVTSYVCDISGKTSSDKNEFVDVTITATDPQGSTYCNKINIKLNIHRDIAKKYHLIRLSKDEAENIPEPSLEAKLVALLRQHVEEIAAEAGAEAAYNVMNRG